ncbi:hypothetical protein ECP03052936_1670, partial [Escherichia coli p0305293.6]
MQEILHISLSIVCKTENKQQIINVKCLKGIDKT